MFRWRRRLSRLILLSIVVFLFLLNAFDRNRSDSFRSIEEEIRRAGELRSRPNFCFSKDERKSVRRAILLHFPLERSKVYLVELKWFFFSWLKMIESQPTDWRTDLIIFSRSSTIFNQLGCRPIGQRSEPNDCFTVEFRSIWSDDFSSDDPLFREIRREIPSWCSHLDSLAILLSAEPLIEHYDYFLRTDIDVFLTNRFSTYIPFDCSFQIGSFHFELFA